MYGIGSSYYNSMFTSMMFGANRYGGYGSSGLFGGISGMGNSAWNSWNSMVPNYAQINYSLLGKYLENNYSDISDKLSQLSDNQQASKSFYSSFNSQFNELKSAAGMLKSFSSSSVFRPTGYGSSNSGVASVTSDNAATPAEFQLNVKQTASAQSYVSNAVSSTGNTLSGKMSLTLTNADQTKSVKLDFDFDPKQSNKTSLSQIASAVNKSNMGITASVSQNDNGKSTLILQSDKTGEKQAFTAEYTGAAAEKLGLTEDQKAQDAIYSVDDGEEQTSATNDVRLQNGDVRVTLKGEGTTQIARNTRDDSKVVDAVKEFAESYNESLAFLTKNMGKSSALNSLAYSFSTTRFQSGALSKIGIAVDSAGALTVDEDRLKSALQDKPQDVERLLGGSNGLATNTYGRTVNALNNSRDLYPQSPSVSYANYMYGRDRSYISSYMNGMFLSSLI